MVCAMATSIPCGLAPEMVILGPREKRPLAVIGLLLAGGVSAPVTLGGNGCGFSCAVVPGFVPFMGPPVLPAFTVAPGALVDELWMGPGFTSEGVPIGPDCFNKGVPVGAGFFKSGVPVVPGAFSPGTFPDAGSIPPPPLLANGGCGGATIMKFTSNAMFWQEPQCAARSEKVGFTMRGSIAHWALMIWIGSRIPTLGRATGENTPGCVTVSLTWRSGPTGTWS